MNDPKLLISIGAEGGSIALYGDNTDPAHPRYRMMVVDQTPTFLTGDESGLEIRRDSGWLSGWDDAMTALGRYPWANLYVLYVDPTVAAEVWKSLQDYATGSGQPVREGALSRWRDACGRPRSDSEPGV
jgi:hypothetical protein